jgi:hypothetical protein
LPLRATLFAHTFDSIRKISSSLPPCWCGAWALNREPQAKGRFKADQDDAQKNERALWKGCFIAPRAYTNDRSAAIPMGQACTGNRVVAIKASIFPPRPVMPPGCTIKGSGAKRAGLSGHRGI